MTYRLSHRQLAWLSDPPFSREQRLAFLGKGPADVGSFFRADRGAVVYRPMVRGTVIGEDVFEDPKEALIKAKAEMERLAQETAGVALDEAELGIDDTNHRIADSAEQGVLSLGTVLHLGAVAATLDLYRDALEDLIDDLIHGNLESLFEGTLPTAAADRLKVQLERISALDAEEGAEEFVLALSNAGVLGFLICVSTPIPSHFSETGYSFSWGLTRRAWIYGDSFEEAVANAAQWATAYRENERARRAA